MNKEEQLLEEVSIVSQEAKEHLIDFAILVEPRYKPNWHHELIARELENIEKNGDKDYKVLLITVPPRHGKSELCSILFPAWYLGRNPDKEIITVSYSGELAQDFGSKTRSLINDQAYKLIFDVRLKEDEQAKAKWKTQSGGSYTSTGVGGAITGRGANILLFDDPIKNREEAESEVYRNKVWQFFTSTAFTRLEPNAVIIVILCMTGDTPVLMEDGRERALRDIQVGDRVATYDKGKLSVSTVLHWANNGRDNILKIITSSGKIIRSNGRHPFLVYEKGKLKWIQAKNLYIAQKIVTVRGNGANGKERIALTRTVKNQQFAVDSVCSTMERKSGQTVTALLQLVWRDIVKGVLNIITGLQWRNMIGSLRSKMDFVLFATLPPEKMFAPIGVENSVLTTVTKPIRYEGCFAMIAILRSVIRKLKRLLSRLWNTSDFTLDYIISIEEDGVEEVFDLQVEKTENFIANGVVSHNTRWHIDDLAGRILQNDELSKRCKIIHFPAISSEGEALWPQRYGLKELEEIKNTIGPYDWSALYQGSPILTEKQEFKPEWYKYITEEELERKSTNKYLTIDTALSKRNQADYCGFCDNEVDKENFWHLRAWRVRLNADELVDTLFTLHQKRKYVSIGIEKTAYTDGLKPFLDEEQRKRGNFLPIIELKHNQTAKEIRIRGLIPHYASGSIKHIKGQCANLEEEEFNFPFGKNDDVLDATAYQMQIEMAPMGVIARQQEQFEINRWKLSKESNK